MSAIRYGRFFVYTILALSAFDIDGPLCSRGRLIKLSSVFSEISQTYFCVQVNDNKLGQPIIPGR